MPPAEIYHTRDFCVQCQISGFKSQKFLEVTSKLSVRDGSHIFVIRLSNLMKGWPTTIRDKCWLI